MRRMSLSRMLLALGLICCGCAPEGPPRKATFPVTGEVIVDGKSASGVTVTLHDLKGIDGNQPTYSSAITDASGKFSVSTYNAGDGVPVGDYVLTFTWGEFNMVSRSMEGDKLKGQYNNAKTSEIRAHVEEGKPMDLGRIELTIK